MGIFSKQRQFFNAIIYPKDVDFISFSPEIRREAGKMIRVASHESIPIQCKKLHGQTFQGSHRP